MCNISKPKSVNKTLNKLKSASKGDDKCAKEAQARLGLLEPYKSKCCGKKLKKMCKGCPRQQPHLLQTPLKEKAGKRIA